MNTYRCRDHGGTFMIQARRGRPPVRCTEDNPCKQDNEGTPKRTRREVIDAAMPIGKAERKPTRREMAAEREELAKRDRQEKTARAPKPNMSVPLAQAAKAELETLGWTAKGRGWYEEDDGGEFPGAMMAEVIASRGSESLVITWNDGALIKQDYNLWHNKRSLNGMPATKLKFNPDEMTDRELIRAIAGMKVTWWNSLAKAEESFVVSPDKLSIEHFYSSNGDEDGGRRIVKFLAMDGLGFRHFYAEALLKIG